MGVNRLGAPRNRQDKGAGSSYRLDPLSHLSITSGAHERNVLVTHLAPTSFLGKELTPILRPTRGQEAVPVERTPGKHRLHFLPALLLKP